jgi:hypothetical protein
MFCYFAQPKIIKEENEQPQDILNIPCEWENGYFPKTSK